MSRLGAWVLLAGVSLPLLTGCAAGPGGALSLLHRRADAAALRTTQVAPGVYVVPGAGGEVEPGNRGRIGNAGFIVGPAGVLAIDSGTSYRHGVALLAAIRAVTDQPVRMLLLTHTRQEFLFGSAAFRELGIPIQMQARAAALMAARCEACLRTLRRVLGDAEMQGTAVVKPDQVFDDAWSPAVIGRPVQVLHFGHSSGPGDIAVLDETTGTLFAGGLVDHGRIPDVQDSRLPAWLQALAVLRQLPVRVVVPGHGPTGPPAHLDTVRRYLLQLQRRAADLLQAGAPLSEVPDRLQQPEFERWDQYETIHRRNASVVFLRLEQDRLMNEGAQP